MILSKISLTKTEAAPTISLGPKLRPPRNLFWPTTWAYFETRVRQPSLRSDLKIARQLRPNEIVVQLSLGQAYLDENHPELAEPLFQSALIIDRSSAAAMVGLGKVALSAGKFGEAVKYFEAALAAQPQASSIHYILPWLTASLEICPRHWAIYKSAASTT